MTSEECIKIQVPYRHRQYYAHLFKDLDNGRWEAALGYAPTSRHRDATSTMRLQGRIFTVDESVNLPTNLPNETALLLVSPEGEAAAEYKQYLKSLEN